MASPLDKVASQVGRAFNRIFYPATLTRSGEVTGGDPWNPTTGDSGTHTCKALVSSWDQGALVGGLVRSDERKILILASTLDTEPRAGDQITVEMPDGTEESFVISSEGGSQPAVKTDPAKAGWVVRAS